MRAKPPLRSMNPQMIARLNLSAMREEIDGLDEDWWNRHRYRTGMPHSPHREADDIILRFQERRYGFRCGSVQDDLESVPYPAWWALPETRTFVYRMMYRLNAGRIGRAVITRLRPGKQIYPHVDDGDNAEYYDRLQICVRANYGCVFKVGDLGFGFHQSEVWWFDNRVEHSVVNGGDTDRITLVMDLRVESEKDGWRNPKASDHRAAGAVAA